MFCTVSSPVFFGTLAGACGFRFVVVSGTKPLVPFDSDFLVQHRAIRFSNTATMFQRLLSFRNMPLLRSSTVKKHIFGSSRSLSVFSLHAGQPGVVFDLTPYSATKSKGNRQRRNTSKLSFVSKRSLCSSSEGILAKSPSDFVQLLQDNNINRCYVVYDKKTGKPKASHPELQELADFFAADDIDYRQHEGAFMALGMRTKALLGAFIWRTNRGQAVSLHFVMIA